MTFEHFTPNNSHSPHQGQDEVEFIDPAQRQQNYQIYLESQRVQNERQFQYLPSGKSGWSYAQTPNDGHFGHHQGQFYILTKDLQMIPVQEAVKRLSPKINRLIQFFEGVDPRTQALSSQQALQYLTNCYRHPQGLRGPIHLEPRAQTPEPLPQEESKDNPEINGQKLFKKAKKKGLAAISEPGKVYEFLGQQTLMRSEGRRYSVLVKEGSFVTLPSPQVKEKLQELYQDEIVRKRLDAQELSQLVQNIQFEEHINQLNPESWQLHFRWYNDVSYAPGPDWAVRTAGGKIFLYHPSQGYRVFNAQTYTLEKINGKTVDETITKAQKEYRKNLEFDRYYEVAFTKKPGRWVHLGNQVSPYYLFLAREENGIKTLYRRRLNSYGPNEKSTEKTPGRWQ